MTEPVLFSIHQGMKSGIGEQASHKYKKIEGKRGNWYIALQENEADNVYFSEKPREGYHSEGFGGRVIKFELEDGTLDEAQGPWHSNANSLLNDTGYDVTHKYYTQGIIATRKEYAKKSYGPDEFYGILHYDEKPILGDFSRIEIMAQCFANKLDQEVYFSVVSQGGGSSHFKKPKK
jgi:hypothetical protein